MRAYTKSIFRSFKNNLSRFIAITLIVLIGSVFISGLGTLTYTIEQSISEEFIKYKGADLILKNLSPSGFDDETIEEIASTHEVKGVKKVTYIDIEDSRLIISDLSNQECNVFELTQGQLIDGKNQILSDRLASEVGNYVTFYNTNFEVVGSIKNPLIYSKNKELNHKEEEIQHYYYLDSNYFDLASFLPITDLYISIAFDEPTFIFSDDYQRIVDALKMELEDTYNVKVLTYNESVSYQLVSSYSDKINVLCFIFPIFFLLVSCLVVLSTMTRLIEEERSQMGCYLSLGFSKQMILVKYILFSLSCCLIGSVIGFFIGIYGIPHLLYNVFNTIYFLPPISKSRRVILGVIGIVVTVVSVLLVSISVVLKELKDKLLEINVGNKKA